MKPPPKRVAPLVKQEEVLASWEEPVGTSSSPSFLKAQPHSRSSSAERHVETEAMGLATAVGSVVAAEAGNFAVPAAKAG